MTTKLKATVVFVVLAAAGGGCTQKGLERFRDARVSGRNGGPADVITMPDGFSNVATKCDHGNRVYSAFKGDANRAALAVVPQDPSCQR